MAEFFILREAVEILEELTQDGAQRPSECRVHTYTARSVARGVLGASEDLESIELVLLYEDKSAS